MMLNKCTKNQYRTKNKYLQPLVAISIISSWYTPKKNCERTSNLPIITRVSKSWSLKSSRGLHLKKTSRKMLIYGDRTITFSKVINLKRVHLILRKKRVKIMKITSVLKTVFLSVVFLWVRKKVWVDLYLCFLLFLQKITTWTFCFLWSK